MTWSDLINEQLISRSSKRLSSDLLIVWSWAQWVIGVYLPENLLYATSTPHLILITVSAFPTCRILAAASSFIAERIVSFQDRPVSSTATEVSYNTEVTSSFSSNPWFVNTKHFLPCSDSSTSAVDGFGFWRSKVYIAMTNPGVQNPHCDPCPLLSLSWNQERCSLFDTEGWKVAFLNRMQPPAGWSNTFHCGYMTSM